MKAIEKQQKEICFKYGSGYLETPRDTKVGIALDTIGNISLNALRLPPEGGTSGWYIWAGKEMSQEADFFQPLHALHLKEYCPEIIKYLGLAPGWRVLVAEEYEDIWYDEGIIRKST